MSESPDQDLIDEEERRVRKVRLVVDLTSAVLWQADITLEEAFEVTSAARRKVLELFPESANTYDLIYSPRFRRIITERFSLN